MLCIEVQHIPVVTVQCGKLAHTCRTVRSPVQGSVERLWLAVEVVEGHTPVHNTRLAKTRLLDAEGIPFLIRAMGQH